MKPSDANLVSGHHVEPRESPTNKPALIKNRFLVLEELGQGGYGSVNKAIDTLTNEQVAIKFVTLFQTTFRIKKQRPSSKRALPSSKSRNLSFQVPLSKLKCIRFSETNKLRHDCFTAKLHSYRVAGTDLESDIERPIRRRSLLHRNSVPHRSLARNSHFLTSY